MITDEMVEACCKAIWYSWNKPHVTEGFRIAMRRLQRQGLEAAMAARAANE